MEDLDSACAHENQTTSPAPSSENPRRPKSAGVRIGSLAMTYFHWKYNQLSSSGPLVLGAAPVNLPTPTADRDKTVSRRFKPSSRTSLNGEQPYPWDRLQPQDEMSRHRGAKHRRRYELLGGISLLSPEYLLSVERWPFHAEPPDHYDLLSYLLDLSVSQSSTLLPLHYQHDFRPYLAYLRTPPLPFRRRPPQSNCLPCTVPEADYAPRLEPQTNQGGISRLAPLRLAS